MCITEYNKELHLNNVLAEGINEGIAIGRNEGIAIGRDEGEERMGQLIKTLISQQKFDEIEQIMTDKAFRQKCFEFYNL